MNKQANLKNYIQIIAFALLLLSLLPWLSTYLAQMVNVDIAFLTLSAERLLDGELMSEAYYDTNPPLSIIIQVPPALLSKLTSIPLYYSISIYILTLLTLSTIATYLLLKNIPSLTDSQVFIILSTFIVTNTVYTGYDFGQKDHLLGMALFPLVLAQILITLNVKTNILLKYSVLLLGSIFILLKPHYGLIPAAIFLHRITYQRRITIFKDPDFLFLSAIAIAYIGVIYIFFNDFITIILPDIITFYATDISSDVVSMGLMIAILPISCAIISLFIFKNMPKIIPALFFISALSIIPFILQGKGWLYHLLPAVIIFAGAFSILFERLMRIILSDLKSENKIQATSLSIIFLAIISFTIYSGLAPSNKPTHHDYLDSELVTIINECKEQECSFLLLNDMINMSHELSIYTKQKYASRFPVLWSTPYLLSAQNILDQKKNDILLTQDEIDVATLKYTNMVIEDFQKYSPQIIFVGHFSSLTEDGKSFNHIGYFLEKNPNFKNIWNNYKFERTISIDRIEYMIGKLPNETLIKYDIYKRKPEVRN